MSRSSVAAPALALLAAGGMCCAAQLLMAK